LVRPGETRRKCPATAQLPGAKTFTHFARLGWTVPKLIPAQAIAVAIVLAAPSATAQQVHGDTRAQPATSPTGWTWTADANLFFGHNYQQRQFLDTSAWESQNWVMVEARRPLWRGRLGISAMLSLEPFTLKAEGSPQLFQTGETYRGLPLVHYQHPHDLVMGLGVTYQWSLARGKPFLGIDLVGAPTLGPPAFMHRESARNNPQAPLAHHLLDSTHITPGVVRGGVTFGSTTMEGSVFRGAEPNDNRLDVERPAFDSWAVRGRYERGAWTAQASIGHLREPEVLEPFDVTRITASVSYAGHAGGRPLRALAAWGFNHSFNGFNGNHAGYLAEWDLRVRRFSTVFGRAEVVDKELFPDPMPHPKGQGHPHFFFTVTSITAGYLHDLLDARWGRVGLGADATIYRMPRDVRQFWNGSRAFHAFLRWRPRAGEHVH
jgi:hypothetical protein